MRCSEFSADRAAAVFCGGPDKVVDIMLRLAGGSKEVADEIDAEIFMQQAAEYAAYVGDSKWNKLLEFLALMNVTHPFLAVRAASIKAWCNGGTYGAISMSLKGLSPTAGEGHCPKCGAPVTPGWAFCRKCGNPIKS